ncbi:MAG: helix-turn-helix domain-containing protein [Dehalococcoidia bacterium]
MPRFSRTGSPPVQAHGSSEEERWLSLREACRLLGVDESTLRRWADGGHLRTFRTPGGHRRFAESDLRDFLARRGGEHQGHKDAGELAAARIRRHLQRGREHQASWYASLDEESRRRLRPLGRHLTSLASAYLTQRRRRSALLEEARDTGRVYGRELAASGLRLSQTVEAFAFFRRSLAQAARDASQSSGPSLEAALEASEQVTGLADEVLAGIAEAYESPAGQN